MNDRWRWHSASIAVIFNGPRDLFDSRFPSSPSSEDHLNYYWCELYEDLLAAMHSGAFQDPDQVGLLKVYFHYSPRFYQTVIKDGSEFVQFASIPSKVDEMILQALQLYLVQLTEVDASAVAMLFSSMASLPQLYEMKADSLKCPIDDILASDVFLKSAVLMEILTELVETVASKLESFQIRLEKRSVKAAAECTLFDLPGHDIIVDGLWTLWTLTRSQVLCRLVTETVFNNPDINFIHIINSFYNSILKIRKSDGSMENGNGIDDRFLFLKNLVLASIMQILETRLFSPTNNVNFDEGLFHATINELLMKENEDDFGKVALADTCLIVDLQCMYNLISKLQQLKGRIDEEQLNVIEFGIVQMCSGCNVAAVEQVKSGTLLSDVDETGQVQAVIDRNVSEQDTVRHMERMSLISQIKDLFPDFGDGFLDACLKMFNDSVEEVIARLCDDSLPESLKQLDRHMPLKIPNRVSIDTSFMKTSDRITELPSYDALFPEGKSSEHPVQKHETVKLLDDKSAISEAMRQRISAFSVYEDEYDDTYDDVPKETPAAMHHEETADEVLDEVESRLRSTSIKDPNEFELLEVYTSDPDQLTKSRRSTEPREKLKRRTGMTDEQIEGWKVMFDRNPDRRRIVEEFELMPKQHLNRQLFKAAAARGQAKPRGAAQRGRGGRGGRGRGSGANHNRKNQRDKKMARGMSMASNAT